MWLQLCSSFLRSLKNRDERKISKSGIWVNAMYEEIVFTQEFKCFFMSLNRKLMAVKPQKAFKTNKSQGNIVTTLTGENTPLFCI